MITTLLGFVFIATTSPVVVPEVTYISWRRKLDAEEVLRPLAACESGTDPKAVNPKDSDGRPKYGLFQYDERTWLYFQDEMGVSGLDIFNPHDQILVTKWAMDNGKASHWGICL